MSTHLTTTGFGPLLRQWRDRRRMSQLDLSVRADVSTRHISFLETGRSQPSREMVLRLAEQLGIPLREQNELLVEAGFAPAHSQRSLDAPEMAPVRDVIDLVLRGHEPCPAVAVDRAWDIVAMNQSAGLLAGMVAEHLRLPRPNVYRMALHPDGLAPRVVNFTEFAHHLVAQLQRDVDATADPGLTALLEEVMAFPDVAVAARTHQPGGGRVAVPMQLRHPTGPLSLFTVISTFGTPADVTVDELAIETFFPADDHTAAVLQAAATEAVGE